MSTAIVSVRRARKRRPCGLAPYCSGSGWIEPGDRIDRHAAPPNSEHDNQTWWVIEACPACATRENP